MPLYAAHAPPGPPSLAGADRVALVQQGFSWPAFVLGPWWLAAMRLWLALIGWIVVTLALIGGGYTLGAPVAALYLAQALVALWLGLEAARLRSAALARAGRPLADVVAAPDEGVALRAFFARWLEGEDVAAPPPPAERPAESPAPPRAPGEASLRQPVVGLFPQPWGRER
jgi:hypothetical protein